MFEIEGKVALITGGASGIGFQYAKQLLKHKLGGVVLADINREFGEEAIENFTKNFGVNKALFIETDVTNFENLEAAFKKTIEVFQHLDILINNAGINKEIPWERCIAINFTGVVNGMILALVRNYIPQYKSGAEGVIVNISSITALRLIACCPVYSATKRAVLGLSTVWGCEQHYCLSKVKVLAYCPGMTATPLIENLDQNGLKPEYYKLSDVESLPVQCPERVAEGLIKIIGNGKSGSIWVVEAGNDPFEYIPKE